MAAENIAALGYQTHVPMAVVRRAGKPDKARPVFVGYVFVEFDAEADPDWPLIARTTGVKRLFMATAVRPNPLPVGWVEKWQAMGRNGVIDDRAPVYPVLDASKPVDVVGGSFFGHRGMLQMADDERAVVMLSLLGREVPVSISRQHLEQK